MVYFELVWEIVRQIPSGQVSTYGRLAACPADVPWQRVINAQGKVSLRSGGGGEGQRAILESEGVEFDDKDRVDLARFLWEGPPQEWLLEHGLVEKP
jgi:methylated-DNA-protein-cysteine methyltransferase-like protein